MVGRRADDLWCRWWWQSLLLLLRIVGGCVDSMILAALNASVCGATRRRVWHQRGVAIPGSTLGFGWVVSDLLLLNCGDMGYTVAKKCLGGSVTWIVDS
jgi:hypothetical protein